MASGAMTEAGLPAPVLEELKALIARGEEVSAIRRYRQATGCDLATAKDAVEALGAGMPAAPAAGAGAALKPALRAKLVGTLRLFTGFLWLCAALAAIAAAWEAYDRSVVEHRWPVTEAEVVKCAIVTHSSRRGPDFDTLGCTFRYRVEGVERTARTGSTGIPSAEQEAAMHRFIARHPPGARQAIHYDPADPRSISLGDADAAFQADTPQSRLRLAGLFAGGGVLLFAISMWLVPRLRAEDAA